MKILWVSPDYADAKPKPCMAGWGSVFLVGRTGRPGAAMPQRFACCPASRSPDLRETSVRSAGSTATRSNRYRGTAG